MTGYVDSERVLFEKKQHLLQFKQSGNRYMDDWQFFITSVNHVVVGAPFAPIIVIQVVPIVFSLLHMILKQVTAPKHLKRKIPGYNKEGPPTTSGQLSLVIPISDRHGIEGFYEWAGCIVTQ